VFERDESMQSERARGRWRRVREAMIARAGRRGGRRVGDVVRSGQPRADALLSKGDVTALARASRRRAVKIVTRLATPRPTGTRPWNKRATARYLAADFAGASATAMATLGGRCKPPIRALGQGAVPTWPSSSTRPHRRALSRSGARRAPSMAPVRATLQAALTGGFRVHCRADG